MRGRWIGCALLAALGAACEDTRPEDTSPVLAIPAAAVNLGEDAPLLPLPLAVVLDADKVALGERLFGDRILSRDKDTSCTVCHLFDRGGADGASHSQLVGKQPLGVNTPSIFNLAFQYKLHWNGKYESLEAQIDTPLTSPNVMNMTYEEVVKRLSESAEYRSAFQKTYPDGVTEANFRDAIATYERSLITPRSRFDRFLAGEADAIDDREKQGYGVFKDLGCVSCHQGVNVGGNMMQRFGALKDYFAGRATTEADLGHYLVTKREEDKHVFRVASLRNVALTAPYFHNGSAKTLHEAVRVMAEYQLGRPLSDEQTDLVVLFLGTLTGEVPKGPGQ